MTGLQTLVVTK